MKIDTEKKFKRMIILIIITHFFCCIAGDIGFWPLLIVEIKLFSWDSYNSFLYNVYSKFIFVGEFLLVFALFSRKIRSILILGIIGSAILVFGIVLLQGNYTSIYSIEAITSIPLAISVLIFYIAALLYFIKNYSKV